MLILSAITGLLLLGVLSISTSLLFAEIHWSIVGYPVDVPNHDLRPFVLAAAIFWILLITIVYLYRNRKIKVKK